MACRSKPGAKARAIAPWAGGGAETLPGGIYPTIRQRALGSSVFSLSKVPPGAPGGGEEAVRASLEALTRCQNPLNLRKTPSSNPHPTFLVRTLFSAFGSLLTSPTASGGPQDCSHFLPTLLHARACAVTHTHTLTHKNTHTPPRTYTRWLSACGTQNA